VKNVLVLISSAAHPALNDGAINAAIDGVGVTRVLSYQADHAYRAGTLDFALQPFEPPPRPVNLVYAQRGRLPIKVRAFIDFAVPRLTAKLKDSG